MLSEIKVPDLGEGILEAEVVRWHVRPGQSVRADDIIVEVQTDKAVIEIKAQRDGTVGSLAAGVGQIVRVGASLFWLQATAEEVRSEPYYAGPPRHAEDRGGPPADRTMPDFSPAKAQTPPPAPGAAPRAFEQTIADVGQAGRAGTSAYSRDQTTADAGSATAAETGSAGSLEILTVIGEGGMARVFLARDTRRNKFVAVKRILDQFVGDAKAVARFQAEADAMRRLQHDHIVSAFESSRDASGPYIVMEFVEGPQRPPEKFPRGWQDDWPSPSMSLEEYVKERGKLSLKHTVTLGARLCLALARAHGGSGPGSPPMFHRDIHPRNVLLLKSVDHPKLVDFGLVKQRDAREISSTIEGGRIGREGYMAPEQETDASTADHRSDIYSLARTLWFAATGDRPQDFLHSRIDEALRAVLLKASDTTRERRYQNAADFGAALERCLAQATGPAAARSAADSWECSCKRINSDSVRFCEACGSDSMTPCENCKKPTRVTLPICRNCGVHRGKFIENAGLLEIAEAAGRARHYHASVAIFLKIAEDQQAEVTQKAQSRTALRDYQPAATKVNSELAQLQDALEKKNLLQASKLIVNLRPRIAAAPLSVTWPEDVRDLRNRARFAELCELARQSIKQEAHAAMTAHRLDAWADASSSATEAFRDEPWTSQELFQGVQTRKQLHDRLIALDQKVTRGEVDLPADYDRFAEELRSLARWTGHQDQGKLDRGIADVETKRLRCADLYAKWQRGRAKLGDLIRLRTLLPRNEEIRLLVAKRQRARQDAKARRSEVRAAVRRLRANATWPIARWAAAWGVFVTILFLVRQTSSGPKDEAPIRAVVAISAAIAANCIARAIARNAGRLLQVKEVGFRWFMALVTGGWIAFAMHPAVARTLRLSALENFTLAIVAVLVIAGARARFSPLRLLLWGLVPFAVTGLVTTATWALSLSLSMVRRGGALVTNPSSKDAEAIVFWVGVLGGVVWGILLSRCILFALESGLRSSIRFGTTARHVLRFIVLAYVSYWFIGTVASGSPGTIAGGAMLLGAALAFFRSRSPSIRMGYRGIRPGPLAMESIAPLAGGIIGAMVLMAFATYLSMSFALGKSPSLSLGDVVVQPSRTWWLIIGAAGPLAVLAFVLRGTCGRRVLAAAAIPLGVLLSILLSRLLVAPPGSAILNDRKYSVAYIAPDAPVQNRLHEIQDSWKDRGRLAPDLGKWVMTHRADNVPSLWGGLAAASILCLRPLRSGRSRG